MAAAAGAANSCGAEAVKNRWAGEFVIARHPGAALRVGQRVIEAGVWGRLLEVSYSQGPWLWIGRGWLRESDAVRYEDAVGYFSARIAERPSAFAFISRGVAECAVHQFERALADLNEAIRLEPREFRAYRKRSTCFSDRKMRAEQIRDLNTAIGLCPTDARAYIGRALAWAYRNLDVAPDDRRRALDDLARAIELAPGDAEPYAVRAQILEKCGELDAALYDASEAIRHDHFLPAHHSCRATILFALGRRAEGRAEFDRAERLDSTPRSRNDREFCEKVLFPTEEQKRVQLAKPLGKFAIAKWPSAVILPVVGNGAEYRFLVDTGSTYCTFHARHRGLLGESRVSLRAHTATGESRMPFYLSPWITIGHARVLPGGAFCVDLRSTEIEQDARIDGILGCDALRQVVLSIDFDGGVATLLPAADPSCGQAVPLLWHKKLLFK